MKKPNYLLPLAAVALLAFAARLPAQNASDSESAEEKDEVVVLSEFTVSTNRRSEYMAAESVTGTRVASKIKDLPFTVNVVTGEFMDDFNALEFGDQFAFTSNVVGYETVSTGYSVRGFEADVQLRNGFRRIGLIDKVNVDRAEVIKGPAASIYGATLPGGIVNVITKKPSAKPAVRLSVAAGSDDYQRAEASSTGPVGSSSQFFYRVDLAGIERDYDLPYKNMRQYTGSVQLQWKPNASTGLLIEAERLIRQEHGNSNVPFTIENGYVDPYRVSAKTGVHPTTNRYVGLADELFDFNTQGPNNYSKRYVNTLTGTLEHRFNSVFSFRSSANWYDRDLVRQEVAGRDQYNPATGRISSATSATGSSSSSWVPRLRPYGESGAGWQNDLLASFHTGGVSHKLLITLDWQRQSEQPQQYNGSAASFPDDSIVLKEGLDPANPDYRFFTYAEKPETYTASQNEDNSLDVYGLFVSERATFLDGRLVALLGGRYDYVRNHSRTLPLWNVSDATNAAYVKDVRTTTDSFTYQTGLNVQIVPAVTFYANASKSFVPQAGFGTDPVTFESFALPNETGEGWETGFKASLLRDRLTFTLGYFDIIRSNVARDTTDQETGTTITYLSGEEQSKGVELDFNWVLTDEFQLFGGYGYTDSTVLSNATAPYLVGTSTRRTPANTLGLGAKYDIKHGPFKGLYFVAGYKYNSESLVNPSTGRNITASTSTPIINTRLPNGLLLFPDQAEDALVTSGRVRVDDGREAIFNPAYQIVDFGAGYRFRAGPRRLHHKIQVNLSNALDEIYTYGSAGRGARRAVSFTYTVSY